MRIVRLANFVTPHSGGLRTALRELGAGYAAAGHESVLVMPGAADADEQTPQGRVITLRGPVLPLSGGYRLLLSKRRVRDLLESLRPDRLEVSDRTTLRWTGPWADRWTWSITASPATWWHPATRGRSPPRWRGSGVTRGCAS